MANRDDEDPKARLDRELIELLNELRVALPGVQVLFAFLLTVPFTERFASLSRSEQAVYFATFVATTVASIFLMAPASYHRIRFREGDKERLLHTASRFAIAGTGLLALAIAGAVLLVTDAIYGVRTGAIVAGCIAGALAWCWFGLPLLRRAKDPST
jgi:hypothetical protein